MVEQFLSAILDTLSRLVGIWIILMAFAGFVALAITLIRFVYRDCWRTNRPVAMAVGWAAESGAGEAIP